MLANYILVLKNSGRKFPRRVRAVRYSQDIRTNHRTSLPLLDYVLAMGEGLLDDVGHHAFVRSVQISLSLSLSLSLLSAKVHFRVERECQNSPLCPFVLGPAKKKASSPLSLSLS